MKGILGFRERGAVRSVAEAERLRLAGDPRRALKRLPRAVRGTLDARAQAVKGLALRDTGDLPGAISCLERSLAIHLDPVVMNELGLMLLSEGRLARAQALFEQAARLAPRLSEPLANLGVVHLRAMRPDRAVAPLEKAVELEPRDLSHRLRLLSALRDAGDSERAMACLREAEELFPGDAKLGFRRATLEREAGDIAQARARLEGMLESDPDDVSARRLLGMVLQDCGDHDRAQACFDAILRRIPEDPRTRFLRGLLSLARGDFASGWEDYEARFLTEESPDPGLPYPKWDGRPLDGALLVYGEQGLGDEVMFASCIREASRRSGRCILQCDPRLGALFTRSFPEITVVAAPRADRRWLRTIPRVAAQSAAGSLPRFFRRDPADFRDRTPYLKADPARVAHWKRKLAETGDGPYIGVAWRGGIAKTRQRVRSIPLEQWRPLFAARRATWICLQHNLRDGEEEAFRDIVGAPALCPPDGLADLDDMAALIRALDRVVSVCMSLVDLSGALGQHATVLVPGAHEWRYGIHGDRMLWYPSVSLIRQKHGEDWGPAIASAAAEIRRL